MEEKLLQKLSEQLDTIMEMLERRQPKKNRTRSGKMGRPSKKHVVVRFRKRYPEAPKIECIKATGLAIKTVSKYWDEAEN